MTQKNPHRRCCRSLGEGRVLKLGSSGSGRGWYLKVRQHAENSPLYQLPCASPWFWLLPSPTYAFHLGLNHLFPTAPPPSCLCHATCVGTDLVLTWREVSGPSPPAGKETRGACLSPSCSLSLTAVSLASQAGASRPEHS